MEQPASRFASLRLDRRVYILGSAGLIRSVGRSATFVFLPLVLADVYHLSFVYIGALVAAIVPVSTLSFLAGGYLSDRHGRRPFAVFPSFVSVGVMLALWAFLDRGVLVVMGLWAVNSLFMGVTRPVQNAMIGDVTPPSLRVTAFGVQRVFTNTGFALSPAIGGLLATFYGLPSLFLFAGITSAVEGVLLLFLLRESHAGSAPRGRSAFASLSSPFHDRLFVGVLVVLVGLSILMNQFGTPLSLFLGAVRAIPYSEFGLIYAVNGVLVVLLQLPISRVVERRRQYMAWMATGAIAYGTSFLLFNAADAFPFYVGAMSLLTVGEDIVSPTQQTLVASFSGEDQRGSYFGAYSATTNASRVVGPVVGTLLLGLGAAGSSILWGGMFGVSVLVAGGFLLLRREARSRIRPRDGTPQGLPSVVDQMLSGEPGP